MDKVKDVSLFGQLLYSADRSLWTFVGIWFIGTGETGDNFTYSCEGAFKGSRTPPESIELTGFFGREADDYTSTIKLGFPGRNTVTGTITTYLGEFVLSGRLERSNKQCWMLNLRATTPSAIAANSCASGEESLEKPLGKRSRSDQQDCRNSTTTRGKRLRLAEGIDRAAEPLVDRWEYLGDNKVRVFWFLPVLKQGQIIRTTVSVQSKTYGNKQQSFRGSMKRYKMNVLPSDLNGYRTETQGLQEIKLPPVALYEDRRAFQECHSLAEAAMMYQLRTFSCVLSDLALGEHEVSVEVRLGVRDQPERFRYSAIGTNKITISPPPNPVSQLSVLMSKAQLIGKNDEPTKQVVYEPFVVASWLPPSPEKSKKSSRRSECSSGGTPTGYVAVVEAFSVVHQKWVQFGEETRIGSLKRSSTTKQGCTLVALPEKNKNQEASFSKFRVSVAATSMFGSSSPVYSSAIDLPEVEFPQQNPNYVSPKTLTNDDEVARDVEVDFSNCDEATCVICADEIKFDEAYEDVRSLIKHEKTFVSSYGDLYDDTFGRLCSGASRFTPSLHIDEKLQLCPVTPSCCTHLFHLKCLLKWSRTSMERLERDMDEDQPSAKCPLCMQKFKHVVRQSLEPSKQDFQFREIFPARTVLLTEDPKPECFFSLYAHHAFRHMQPYGSNSRRFSPHDI